MGFMCGNNNLKSTDNDFDNSRSLSLCTIILQKIEKAIISHIHNFQNCETRASNPVKTNPKLLNREQLKLVWNYIQGGDVKLSKIETHYLVSIPNPKGFSVEEGEIKLSPK